MSILQAAIRIKARLVPTLWRGRAFLIGFVATLALLTASVAIAQSSQSYDLACRSIIAAGGRISTGGNFGVIAALGNTLAPPRESGDAPTYSIRSTNFGVRGGFLPGYPNGQAVVESTQALPTYIDQNSVQRLPLLFKVAYIIRGGC